ncbi:hypothetical protein GUITHDRAFT_116211 [Guillardia theta CCMP2712]|uniref:Uncharacterized protein n=1 Tax=Guillardia theta (strain CCMP2712) TaxID=905079 RepID=L1INA1_GUITC|nr:hypothetical protein GUITHDRAFT_116211 [Guillardia theta CCMP2712]EKX37572.1 hypothetical protein GUITHDRAFT_116211 [Guillardia theta CCMP2712]|eukprot:XP_005824552.1 hypothetical protein GUITHDRAFT_116211 [Guillardia theta CCMP2712]
MKARVPVHRLLSASIPLAVSRSMVIRQRNQRNRKADDPKSSVGLDQQERRKADGAAAAVVRMSHRQVQHQPIAGVGGEAREPEVAHVSVVGTMPLRDVGPGVSQSLLMKLRDDISIHTDVAENHSTLLMRGGP